MAAGTYTINSQLRAKDASDVFAARDNAARTAPAPAKDASVARMDELAATGRRMALPSSPVTVGEALMYVSAFADGGDVCVTFTDARPGVFHCRRFLVTADGEGLPVYQMETARPSGEKVAVPVRGNKYFEWIGAVLKIGAN